jgi:hypothetical protein
MCLLTSSSRNSLILGEHDVNARFHNDAEPVSRDSIPYLSRYEHESLQ